MSSAFEIRREGEVDYSKPMARALLRDSRLSFGARGLFAFLWDLPGGWRTNSTHLASMSPLGRDAVRTLLKELEAVGAMRDEAIQGKGGRLAGRRWVLVTPERWAIESPLSTHKTLGGYQRLNMRDAIESPLSTHKTLDAAPEASSTERRVFRSSVKPTVGKPNTKVHQGEGSSIKTTTNQVQVVEEIDELVEAAVWAASKSGGKIYREAGFRNKVRNRILSSPTGPNPEDMQSLHAWRVVQTAGGKNVAARNQAAVQEKLEIDQVACVKGAMMLSSNILERIGKQAQVG